MMPRVTEQRLRGLDGVVPNPLSCLFSLNRFLGPLCSSRIAVSCFTCAYSADSCED
jgi:hypothetical protein